MKVTVLMLSMFLSILTISPVYSDTASEAVVDSYDPQVQKQFAADMNTLVGEIKQDKNYKPIPLDKKKDSDWFTTHSFLYWDHKISRDDFVSQGVERFPSHQYEFEFIADKLSTK